MIIESHFCSSSLATFSTVTVSTIGGEERVGERERVGVGGEGERVRESKEEEEGDEGDKGDEGDFEGEGWRVWRG